MLGPQAVSGVVKFTRENFLDVIPEIRPVLPLIRLQCNRFGAFLLVVVGLHLLYLSHSCHHPGFSHCYQAHSIFALLPRVQEAVLGPLSILSSSSFIYLRLLPQIFYFSLVAWE